MSLFSQMSTLIALVDIFFPAVIGTRTHLSFRINIILYYSLVKICPYRELRTLKYGYDVVTVVRSLKLPTLYSECEGLLPFHI